jgi:putative colanic acid biosynthesis acetyltransferase WcaF
VNLATFQNSGFSRGAPAWKEALWIVCRGLFFAANWPLPSAFRCWLLRLFGAQVGKGVVIRSGVSISFPWRLHVGNHVWIGEGVRILSLAPVTIHSDVCISQEAFLCTGSHDYRREDFALVTAPIVIETEVWIAARAFVGPGVTIGPKTVVAACAVVIRDIPAASFASGNPARSRPRNNR